MVYHPRIIKLHDLLQRIEPAVVHIWGQVYFRDQRLVA
jgi:hypothetical protein